MPWVPTTATGDKIGPRRVRRHWWSIRRRMAIDVYDVWVLLRNIRSDVTGLSARISSCETMLHALARDLSSLTTTAEVIACQTRDSASSADSSSSSPT